MTASTKYDFDKKSPIFKRSYDNFWKVLKILRVLKNFEILKFWKVLKNFEIAASVFSLSNEAFFRIFSL